MMTPARLLRSVFDESDAAEIWGTIKAIDSGVIRIAGLGGLASIGDRLFLKGSESAAGEVIAVDGNETLAMPSMTLTGVTVGERITLRRDDGAAPSEEWLGCVLGADGDLFSGGPAPKGPSKRPLWSSTLSMEDRRGVGHRIDTGLAPFDTFLPLCRGQRIGLFAGSGVGKSTLLADLARALDTDIVVLALIGERSREVREFVDETLGPDGMKRSVVIASTCDEAAPAKRRAAMLAMTTAEYFRDQGKQVLLLFDSITRFADAHREIALTAGETPSLRAYPPSTVRAIARLAERAGPGAGSVGDITAVFSVLVAGSDMEEPVADMVRGVLDGHVVLDRAIAERGRFPAIDIRRSVSRSLPKAASEEENNALGEARALIAAYEEAAPMIQTGLYSAGADPVIDRAIALWPALDAFVGEKFSSAAESFERLKTILLAAPAGGGEPER